MAKKDTPRWQQENLHRHFNKHPNGTDKECWKDLLSSRDNISLYQYEDKSEEVVNNKWLEYRAEECDVASRRFNDERAFHIDDQLIKTITTIPNDSDPLVIITCFHEHFGLPHDFNQKNDVDSVIKRRAKFLNNLENRIECGLVKYYRCVYKK